MFASDAAKQIYLYLINIIQSNESGIISDIDTEFLHDFRVSIRRTRSALGQIKGVLDEKSVIKAKENFAFLGKSTNELRDIDVYLLREEQYKSMLPRELRNYLFPFFKGLHEQRKIEHGVLVKTLKSAKYKRILSNWKTYLQLQKAEEIRNIPSARMLAQTIILKRNKKILKFGQQILSTGSDELLHQLRIEGKKLRYLLEFFSSLFVQQKIQYLIEKLKLLQDNLGEFNDLAVQQEKLNNSAKEISLRNKKGTNVVLTLGILIGKLNEKQHRVKNDFAKIFSSYSDIKVQKIFDELFKVQGRCVR
jgi:CHAD domain-containing protein